LIEIVPALLGREKESSTKSREKMGNLYNCQKESECDGTAGQEKEEKSLSKRPDTFGGPKGEGGGKREGHSAEEKKIGKRLRMFLRKKRPARPEGNESHPLHEKTLKEKGREWKKYWARREEKNL